MVFSKLKMKLSLLCGLDKVKYWLDTLWQDAISIMPILKKTKWGALQLLVSQVPHFCLRTFFFFFLRQNFPPKYMCFSFYFSTGQILVLRIKAKYLNSYMHVLSYICELWMWKYIWNESLVYHPIVWTSWFSLIEKILSYLSKANCCHL